MRESLSRLIKDKGKSLGADLVGIAPARPFPEAEHYRRWVEAEMHGTMGYMAKDPEGRMDITRWFSPARSVVLLGFSYSGPSPDPVSPHPTLPPLGRIARYALGQDYHDVLKEKLQELLGWVQSIRPEAEGKPFVDSSAVLERLYARYAGIGWIGKNTMLLSPKIGSYFFLTGLATNLELDYDQPMPDHCGSCTRCLEACPTEAFPKPYTLDASKCIAYFTIEHRGSIPEEFRKPIGDWVFGCDICQEVCPWNRFSVVGRVREIQPEREPLLALEDLARLTPEEFRERFGPTALSRARHRGLMRNALLAMGNSGERRFVPILKAFAEDPDPILREQAQWSLKQLGESSTFEPTSRAGA